MKGGIGFVSDIAFFTCVRNPGPLIEPLDS